MLAAAMVSAFPSPAIGQEKSQENLKEEPLALEAIRIEAPAIEEESETRSSFVTVIRGEELEGRFTSLPEALSETVGVRITRFGGLGDFSTISIRGSTSEQVLIYLDGILLNSAQGGGVNVGSIPVSNIESIEIFRGSSPAGFGQAGIGGVVHIRSKRAGERTTAAAQLQYGSFQTRGLNGLASARRGRWDYLAAIDYTESENDFKFTDDNGTKFNDTDDIRIRRLNNDYRSIHSLLKLNRRFSQDTVLGLYSHFNQTNKGIPGLGSFQSLHTGLRTRAHHSGVTFSHPVRLALDPELEWAFHHSHKIERFRDPLGEIGFGLQDQLNTTQSAEFVLKPSGWIGTRHSLRALLKLKAERFTVDDRLLNERTLRTDRRTVALGLEDRVFIGGDTLVLRPGIAYEAHFNAFGGANFQTSIGQHPDRSQRDRHLTRQLGMVLRLGGGLEFRANIGRYSRAPSLFEQFGDRGGTVGNPDLIPESGLNRDAGLRYSRRFSHFVRELQLQAVYFNNEMEDLIIFIQTSQTSKPQNIDGARISGTELVWKMRLGRYIDISGNYTYQRAVNRSPQPSHNGKTLPGRPVHEFSGKIHLTGERTSLFYTVELIARNYLDPANQTPTRSRSIQNLGASLILKKAVSMTLEVKNLNNNTIEDVFGYPLPGRSYFLTMKGEFK